MSEPLDEETLGALELTTAQLEDMLEQGRPAGLGPTSGFGVILGTCNAVYSADPDEVTYDVEQALTA